jgi:polar amino acid transport system substrate-binding protein
MSVIPGLPPAVLSELAPGGRLRAGINFGNVILASRDPASGELRGVHVDLARELGRCLGVTVELQGRAAAGTLVEELKAGELDVALLSFEPSRAQEIAYSPAYLEVDATYLVPSGSPLRTAADVDRDGVRVAIAARGVYEFYLKRHLKRAKLVSAPSTHAAFELFAAEKLDALVGLRPRLVEDSGMLPGSRIVEGRFMLVAQAIASRRGCEAGARFVSDFIRDAVASGLLARVVEHNRVRGVTVAPMGK